MIRQAYYEDPAYVPLLLRSYELWDDLNLDRPGIITITGGLMLGAADSSTVAGTLASAHEWDLPHELLDAPAIRRRFPAFTPTDETAAVLEKRAGYVLPEESVRTHLARAAAARAELHFGEKVLDWEVTTGGVTVETDRGIHHAERLVITAGAWAPNLVKLPGAQLEVERQLLFWFDPLKEDGLRCQGCLSTYGRIPTAFSSTAFPPLVAMPMASKSRSTAMPASQQIPTPWIAKFTPRRSP